MIIGDAKVYAKPGKSTLIVKEGDHLNRKFMSRSTFKFGEYSLTAGTSVVEVVCGFLLKALKEESLELGNAVDEIVEQLIRHVMEDHGFVRIELPELADSDLKEIRHAVLKSITEIQSWGDYIPVGEVKKIQEEGFLLKEAEYSQDMPTQYILDYFNQLSTMLMLYPGDQPKNNQATNYPIVKGD